MGVDRLLNHSGDSCSMLLACIAVCMSNMSFSLHGFSVNVPCQTHSFSQPSSNLSPRNNCFKISPSLTFLPFCFYFSPSFFFFFLCPLAPANLSLLPLLVLCTKFLNYASFTLYLSSGRLGGLGFLPVGRRGTGRGYQYYKYKAIPYCSPFFFFLQWEASSTKNI